MGNSLQQLVEERLAALSLQKEKVLEIVKKNCLTAEIAHLLGDISLLQSQLNRFSRLLEELKNGPQEAEYKLLDKMKDGVDQVIEHCSRLSAKHF